MPIKPGSEAALALAMANVLLAERGEDRVGLASALASFTPAMAAQETGLSAETIERLAREFAAARPSLAVAGGVGSQHAASTEVCAAVNVLNFVAGNIGETVRFGAELPTADGHAELARLSQAMDAGEVAVALVHDANPAYTLPKAAGSPPGSPRSASRSPPRSTSTRPRRFATCSCLSTTRWSGGTMPGRGPGSMG